MPGCIFISKFISSLVIFVLWLGLLASPVWAAGTDQTLQPEEDDYSATPFTEYGEFNEEAEEATDQKFFQYGRFFGVSVGLGLDGALGNRAKLWRGGFPMIDFKLH